MSRKWIYLTPLALVAIAAYVIIGGGIVYLLWNWLMPDLFGWSTISFLQAVGLLALSRILFGRMGTGAGRRHYYRTRFRKRMAEKMARMTPEERERFRRAVRERWHDGSR